MAFPVITRILSISVDNEQDAAEPGDDEEIVSESESECDFTEQEV